MNLRLVGALAVSAVAVFSACQSESSSATNTPKGVPTAARISVVSGNNQQADPLDSLPQPIQFLVTDESGHPFANATVALSVPLGGGSVPTSTVVSDSTGTVTTSWFMGANGGAQTLLASAGSSVTATANATTCDPSACYPQERLSGTLSAATLLSLATYDGTGEAVHPDIVRGHGSATGFWLAITPYPGGNSMFENPSIFRSNDAVNWTVPTGIKNPIAQPATNGYLSDPDMVANNDNHLWMYYRSVVSSANIVMLTRSVDGTHWDTPIPVITVPSHMLVSPTVVRSAPQEPWQMWSVNTGPYGCNAVTTSVELRHSTNGITWDAPIVTDLAQPGQQIWHIDVQWVAARSEYWALYNTYPNGSTCATNSLYVARSADGVHWTTYPSPIARAGVIDQFQSIVYRSTFMFNPKATQVTLWISGAKLHDSTGYDWRTATVSIATPDLLALAAVPQASLQTGEDRSHFPPPEPDVGPPH